MDDLKEFLNTRSEFTQKSEVVYFLSEVRKIIENNKNYPDLNLYCNWVLHSKLTKESTIKSLNLKLSRFVDFNKSKSEIQKMLARADGGKFIKMEDFKLELIKFLVNKGLSKIIFNGNKWYKFVELYLKIIYKCPIEHGSTGISGLYLSKEKDGYYYGFYIDNIMRIPRIKLKFKRK